MMMATPRKRVHWGPDISLPDFGSFTDTSSETIASTSSLQYINSQLVAHGFISSPGLSLDGISNTDSERVVKCLIGMLGQRMEDMSRTEGLKTKLNTLSYDHGRLKSMHQDATERGANAEREMNMYKSRMNAATKSLQSTENAHKHTTVELQRARTSLQAIRATYQAELKKKEKDIERMVEKWSKLSDAQIKVGGAGSGIRCANVGVVEGTEVLGKGQGFLELALEQAECARNQLGEENSKLRKLMLNAMNEIQSILHISRGSAAEKDEEPIPFTLSTLFPLCPQDTASDKLTSAFSALRASLALSRSLPAVPDIPMPKPLAPDGELERLQTIIDALRAELDRSQKQAAEQAIHTQALFDQFAADHRIMTGDIGEMSFELMTAPAKDEERNRLESVKQRLDEERKNFTEAAVRFGKEKALLEAEKIKFQDEKRSWKFEMMLAELPSTPTSPARAKIPSTKRGISFAKSPRKTPRKSPVKNSAVKIGSGKRTRVSRRSSSSNVEPSYETEVLPPLPAPSFTSKPATSLSQSLLPTSFVLPPPSPFSTLPTQLVLLPTSVTPPTPPEIQAPVLPTQPQIPGLSDPTPPSSDPVLVTPGAVRRPFPMAKPFAPHMVHAYSPVRPSPLSRILMLANSPPSPHPDLDSLSTSLDALVELDEGPQITDELAPPLSSDLGTQILPEKPLENKDSHDVLAMTAPGLKGRVFHPPEPKRFTAMEKGKSKEAGNRPRGSGSIEKENDVKRMKIPVPITLNDVPAKVVSSATAGSASNDRKNRPVAKPTTSRPRLMGKLPPGKVGARRVPIDSAEAAVPVGRGRRG